MLNFDIARISSSSSLYFCLILEKVVACRLFKASLIEPKLFHWYSFGLLVYLNLMGCRQRSHALNCCRVVPGTDAVCCIRRHSGPMIPTPFPRCCGVDCGLFCCHCSKCGLCDGHEPGADVAADRFAELDVDGNGVIS